MAVAHCVLLCIMCTFFAHIFEGKIRMRIYMSIMITTMDMIIPCIMGTKHRCALYTAKHSRFSSLKRWITYCRLFLSLLSLFSSPSVGCVFRLYSFIKSLFKGELIGSCARKWLKDGQVEGKQHLLGRCSFRRKTFVQFHY